MARTNLSWDSCAGVQTPATTPATAATNHRQNSMAASDDSQSADQTTGVTEIQGTAKTLILEIMADNGTGHIREIHLQVTEFRPEVPQHTLRARLSEMANSQNLEEKLSSFGHGFHGLFTENTQMCSVVSYPNRGRWSDPRCHGNCSGHLVKDLILRFGCRSVS